jgi:GNAT superfamily N-acetyltransferase
MLIELSEPATTAQFEAYYDFRWRALRAPWDMPRGSERDELEDSALHIAALTDTGEIAGVGRIHLRDDGDAQIRYMATDAKYRGQGIGKAIVARLEQAGRELGATQVIVNARENALPFYEKLGYTIFEDSPTLIGTIAHKLMRKRL